MFGLGKRYRFQHEFVIYACRGDAPFYGDRAQSDVWEFDKAHTDDSIHNTPKPVAMPLRAIENSSTKGSIVLDVFNGTGTVTAAAEQSGRLCYGMEIEPKYVAVALERMADMGLEPQLVSV
ncbi:MAG: site-specific DNA-methyltransferase [Acidobacteria bacterium]|nr:site-specific DNA-methyltransferase [Acidobacteriota bacterium]